MPSRNWLPRAIHEFQVDYPGIEIELLEGGTTLLFVSHSAEQVKALCPKAVWLDHGQMMAFGDTEEVFRLYENAYRG